MIVKILLNNFKIKNKKNLLKIKKFGNKILIIFLLMILITTAFIPIKILEGSGTPLTDYRKKITINHSLVIDTLVDYPLLVNLGSDGDLAARAQNDGDDIFFSDLVGNKLNHEIEYFDGANGELVAWVKIPYLSSSIDTEIYMYYGNASASNQEPCPIQNEPFMVIR